MRSGSVAGQRQRLSQDCALFGRTIRPKIAYSHPKATGRIAAARAAHLHESVVLMLDSDGTVASEPGVSLSGRQQRITTAVLLIVVEGGRIIETRTRNDLMTRASKHRTFDDGQFPTGPIRADVPAAMPVEMVQCDRTSVR